MIHYLRAPVSLLLLTLAFHLSLAQAPATDSLLRLIESDKEDTLKITHLIQLSNELSKTDLDKALEYSKQANALAKKIDSQPLIGKTFLRTGRIYRLQGKYSEALENYLQALKIFETLNDPQQIAGCLNGIGTLHLNQMNYDKAIVYFNKGISVLKQANSMELLPMFYSNIGSAYLSKQEYDSALHYHLRSLELEEAAYNRQGIAESWINIGNVHHDKGNYDKALEYYLKAQKEFDIMGHKDISASLLVNIGSVYSRKGQYGLAEKHLLQSIDIGKEIGVKDIVKEAYFSLADIFAHQKNWEKAFYYHKLYSSTKDSLFNEESAGQIAEMQTKYETEKKEQEIALLNKEKQKDKVIRYALIGGAVMILLVAFLIYNRYRLKHKANQLLTYQKAIIEEQHKNIKDSINYAQRIQQAILPSPEELGRMFSDFFILYKPKDVVSGDFYSFAEKDGKAIIAAVDCTGHGVPGAFMSMIGHDQLNQLIGEKGITTPSGILTQLNKGIKHALKQRDSSANETRDGMDIAICSVDMKNNMIEFAGAMRPLYHIKHELQELPGDKMSIGGATDEHYQYRSKKLAIQKGDAIYLFSDGYADQFGGPKGKKLMTKNFKKLLLSIHQKPMKEQERILEETFKNWKGDLEQIDDILVIGIRI